MVSHATCMRHFINQLMVAAGNTETDRAETEGAGAETTDQTDEAVAWTDVSESDHVPSGSGTDDLSTTDSPASSEEVETLDAEHLLANVLNGLAAPTLIVDSAGHVSHLNEHACELFETTEAAAVGAPPATTHGGEELVSGVLTTGEGITDREETVVIDGTERTLSRTITPFHDQTGEVVGAMETARDITEKVREQEKTDQLEAYQEAVLDDLQDKLRRLAEGDLTLDSSVPQPTAEFSEMQTVFEEFTDLNDHLTTAVTNYQSVLSRLAVLADDLDKTSQELSADGEEVAASVEEIAQSIEEIDDGSDDLAAETDEAEMAASNLTATIEEITASIQEIDAQTTEASTLALEGVDEGSDAVDQIRTATDATSDITDEVRTLETKMERVGETLDVISDIAEQTNLLALNANIEAARAGDAGDGFAVVADEVKTLAEESKESAAEIEEIITDAQDQTAAVAEQIAHTNSEVSEGADAVETVVDQLEEIETAIEKSSTATAEVSDAVEEQAKNMDSFTSTIDSAASMSEELSASVQEISAGLEQQATATDQVAGRADQLSATSDELYDRIDQFRLTKAESATVDDVDEK